MLHAYCSLCGGEVPINSEGRCPSGHLVRVESTPSAPGSDAQTAAGEGPEPAEYEVDLGTSATTDGGEPEPWTAPVPPGDAAAAPTPPPPAVPAPPTVPDPSLTGPADDLEGEFDLEDLQQAVTDLGMEPPPGSAAPPLPPTATPSPTATPPPPSPLPPGSPSSIDDVAAAAADIAARGQDDVADALAEFEISPPPGSPLTTPDAGPTPAPPPTPQPPGAAAQPAPPPVPPPTAPAPPAEAAVSPQPTPTSEGEHAEADAASAAAAPADIDPYNFTARGSKPKKARRSSSDDDGDGKKGRFRPRR